MKEWYQWLYCIDLGTVLAEPAYKDVLQTRDVNQSEKLMYLAKPGYKDSCSLRIALSFKQRHNSRNVPIILSKSQVRSISL
jgi:hypothetical protein